MFFNFALVGLAGLDRVFRRVVMGFGRGFRLYRGFVRVVEGFDRGSISFRTEEGCVRSC